MIETIGQVLLCGAGITVLALVAGMALFFGWCMLGVAKKANALRLWLQ